MSTWERRDDHRGFLSLRRHEFCSCGDCRTRRLRHQVRHEFREPLLQRARLQAAHAAEYRPVALMSGFERFEREMTLYLEFWAIAREGD